MKMPKNLGMILLAVWAIATGVMFFVKDANTHLIQTIVAAVAIAAGVLILLGR